jgi:D-tyrosyl-tRNA(Tyr) deacylase
LIALIQRVSSASVAIDGVTAASIGYGILALVGVERGDTEAEAERLANRVVSYRIFEDAQQKMNLSLLEIEGELLVVPQFTLAAETKQGNRPGFSTAASPEDGRRLFDVFVRRATQGIEVRTGQFGADMQVNLVNDGPVTFWLQVSPKTLS